MKLFVSLIIFLSTNCFAADWQYVTSDVTGMHYINPSKIKYQNEFGIANFVLLTNDYESGTQNLSGKSTLTQYILYCKANPEVFEGRKLFDRRKMTSYTKLWGKGRASGSLIVATGSWVIEDGKEVEISEFVCKNGRLHWGLSGSIYEINLLFDLGLDSIV